MLIGIKVVLKAKLTEGSC